MKQVPNPKMPHNNSGVSEKQELIYHLKNSTKNTAMLFDTIKKFLEELLLNKAKILEYCDVFDELMTSSLGLSVLLLTPDSNRLVDKSNNYELSVMIE